jgi:hypothetical protein
VDDNVVYVVVVNEVFTDSPRIQAIYKSRASAEDDKKALESNLSGDMIVYVEEHELHD